MVKSHFSEANTKHVYKQLLALTCNPNIDIYYLHTNYLPLIVFLLWFLFLILSNDLSPLLEKSHMQHSKLSDLVNRTINRLNETWNTFFFTMEEKCAQNLQRKIAGKKLEREAEREEKHNETRYAIAGVNSR